MQQYNHLSIARLKEGILDIIIKNIDLIPSNRREPEPIGMRFEGAAHSLGYNIGPYVQVLKFGIAFAL